MTDSTTTQPESTESTSATVESAESAPARPARKRGGGLGGKVIAELQEIANELGIEGVSSMRKGALIDAIKAARGEAPAEPKAAAPKKKAATKADRPAEQVEGQEALPVAEAPAEPVRTEPKNDAPQQKSEGGKPKGQRQRGQKNQAAKADGQKSEGKDKPAEQQGEKKPQQQGGQGQNQSGKQQGGQQDKGQNNQGGQNNQNAQNAQNNQQGQGQGDDDPNGRRRNRRGRGRARGDDLQVAEDDVLVPAAGIVDILDNYAFVRTTGYLPSENDVYVSLSMVRKWGLRHGDAVVGQVRQPREGERKEKFNPMVRVDSVNGMTLEEAKQRPAYDELTPVFASERIRLSAAGTETGRLLDLVAPVGKGQRGLIVAPPASGATTLLRETAAAIAAGAPECHLMIVLIDSRPEEVTEFQRTVKGEVVASSFDRPVGDHRTVAELAVERAKRLVELGHDVVVLVDGLTRLGRAAHQASAHQGRVSLDSVDVSALATPARVLGAGRDLEDGGSLTVFATALTESGSALDDLILAELTGVATSQVRLDGAAAAQRAFPAIDVLASAARRDDLLLSAEEQQQAADLRAKAAASR
ncbi:MAG: transcription termination factor Rho [Aeromicrobium sp.]|uniref:transcription termination factor Rho n=1 Tax=Aeromicrobium sp. TaxID=1871063 RepID=UPI0039E34AFD